ncbi:MAG TPA: hypothetical protein PLA83_04910 [Deltaproteobacteria bacterium]|jgi:hypothetical protein|nr:hypothetical protein [Deltaproteobacteria bacterium]HQI02830.1 hypothetical protein [Deltaproteobacteria bacterium]HQJ08089.1 hypothetical protein [Deltaproteobacteria bacterium]
MSAKSSHGLKGHAGDGKDIKRKHAAGDGKKDNASGDIVRLDTSVLARRDYLVFDFPCYPLEVVDFQGHYFLPVEAVTCRS